MPANFVIDHSPGDVDKWLVRAFGKPSQSALANSVLGNRVQSNPNYRGWQWHDYIVVARGPTNTTLQLSIEPRGSVNMRDVCHTTWRALHSNGGNLKPTLRSLVLEDGVSGHGLAGATTSLGAHLKGPETTVAFATAGVTVPAVLLAVAAGASSEVLLGAIPAVVAALVLAALAVLYSHRENLIWN